MRHTRWLIPYSRCGTRHTCWLIHHLRGVLLPPLLSCTYFTGCAAATLTFARVHPTTLVPFTAKWLSTLLCTYVKRLKLLMVILLLK